MASLGCRECGGLAGHTVRCPHGPGPADAPSGDDLYAVVAALEFPELEVRFPGRSQPVRIPGRRLAWVGFIRWAERRPAAARAVFEALEAYEASWREHAPTAAEVAG